MAETKMRMAIDPLDDEGLVVSSLDEQGEVAGLMIMEASRFAEAS